MTNNSLAKIALTLLALCAFDRASAGEEAALSEAFGSAQRAVRTAALDRTTYLLGLHYQRLWQLRDEQRRIEIAVDKIRQDVGVRTRLLRDRANKECGAESCNPDPRALSDEQITEKVKNANLLSHYVFFSGLWSCERELADLRRQELLQNGELTRVKAAAREIAAKIAVLEKKTPR
ncbi:MAG: hypothetical protein Q8T11_00935 [Elusimicrobiota bacterium]|nr:hypothetical protein [Elusimicrobiota bacterium]